MKKIFYILCVLTGVLAVSSCDSGYDIEHAAIAPLGGQYTITVTDESGNVLVDPSSIGYIANTINEDKDSCWVRIGSLTTSASNAYSINGKIGCNVGALTFSGKAVNLAGNVVTSTDTVSITDGKLILKGATAPSGTVTDSIYFQFTRTNFPGKVYTVSGYRYTLWDEDAN